MDLKNLCVNENDTVLSSISVIEKNHLRNVFVINNLNKIIGILSQGDIIRSIIQGVELHSRVGKIANESFIYLNNKDMDKAYKVFKSKNLAIIPVINKNFELVDVITIQDIYHYLENKA